MYYARILGIQAEVGGGTALCREKMRDAGVRWAKVRFYEDAHTSFGQGAF